MVNSENLKSFSFNFIRRNLVFILIILVAGNLIVFISGSTDKPHFECSIKIHTRGIYYDHLRDLSSRLSDTSFYRDRNLLPLTDAENNSLQSITAQSYRNEDLYIYELKLNFNDSLNWQSVKQKVYDYLENKTELKETYFKRKENISLLTKQIAAAEKDLNRNDLSEPGSDPVIKSIDLMTKKNLNSYMYDMLVREIEVLPVDHDSLHFVQPNKLKSQLQATIIFFIIALFLSVVREQFRKENNTV